MTISSTGRIFFWLFMAGCAFALLPFLWLSLYNLPLGIHEWDWIADYAGKAPAGWWDKQVYFYQTEIGRYTSVAIASITTWWCTLQTFPYYFVALHLIWTVMLVSIAFTFFKGIAKHITWIIAGLLFLTYVDQVDDVYDSMFRYTGLICYLTGSILAISTMITAVKFYDTRKPVWIVIASFFLFASIGTNEVSMLVLMIINAILASRSFIMQGKRDPLLISLFIVGFAGSLLVVLSPGNPVRYDVEGGPEISIWKAIIASMGATFYLWLKWLGAGVLLIATALILAVTDFLQLRYRALLFDDYRPWLISVAGVVPVTMFFLIFSTGADTFPERVVDHLFVYVMLLWLGLWISLCIRWQFNLPGILNRSKTVHLVYGCGLMIVVLMVFAKGLDIDRSDKSKQSFLSLIRTQSNVSNAWLTLIKGEPQQYHQEMMSGYEQLYQCNTDTCYMQRPSVLPSQLYDAASDRRNRRGDPYVGYYFNKEIDLVRYSQQ